MICKLSTTALRAQLILALCWFGGNFLRMRREYSPKYPLWFWPHWAIVLQSWGFTYYAYCCVLMPSGSSRMLLSLNLNTLSAQYSYYFIQIILIRGILSTFVRITQQLVLRWWISVSFLSFQEDWSFALDELLSSQLCSPDIDSFITWACGQHLSSWCKGNSLYHGLVSFAVELRQGTMLLNTPKGKGLVTWACGNNTAIRTECTACDRLYVVPLQAVDNLSLYNIPDSHSFSLHHSCYQRTIRGELAGQYSTVRVP